jgi:hypothetical protein
MDIQTCKKLPTICAEDTENCTNIFPSERLHPLRELDDIEGYLASGCYRCRHTSMAVTSRDVPLHRLSHVCLYMASSFLYHIINDIVSNAVWQFS